MLTRLVFVLVTLHALVCVGQELGRGGLMDLGAIDNDAHRRQIAQLHVPIRMHGDQQIQIGGDPIFFQGDVSENEAIDWSKPLAENEFILSKKAASLRGFEIYDSMYWQEGVGLHIHIGATAQSSDRNEHRYKVWRVLVVKCHRARPVVVTFDYRSELTEESSDPIEYFVETPAFGSSEERSIQFKALDLDYEVKTNSDDGIPDPLELFADFRISISKRTVLERISEKWPTTFYFGPTMF
ncbi:MAG TPA: hypothetical protein VKX17_28255 [Planctomycetota bacterium]|nr:hypothetical protein [Planctomycetota bacterium]